VPELPEVETIRRQLGPVVGGRSVRAADSHPSPKFTPARDVAGARLGEVGRRGKYLLVAVDDDRELVVHLGMTGSLAVAEAPSDDAFVRARWWLDDGSVLEFRDVRRFGRIRVVAAGDYRDIPTLRDLGPEPLDPGFDGAQLWQALRSSRRRLKTQLLSQRPVAGVGNIYADEALWLARLHPAVRSVTRAQAVALRDALRVVLCQGLEHGGTTLRDYRTVDGDPGDNQRHLNCYGRAGHPCARCGATLVSRSYDGRTATWCPACQRRR
jgi:formamidopyrimidine-DNA glycosylase